MTGLAVLCGVCALVIVVLAYLVGRLQGDVRRLNDQVTRLSDDGDRSAQFAPDPLTALDERAPSPATVDVIAVERAREQRDQSEVVASPQPSGAGQPQVAVITAINDDGADLEITRARVASVTLARPLIKVAALSFGFRHALRDEQRFRIRYAMRQELRRQAKMRRRRRARKAPSKGSLS
jgi:hypothetical protein